MKKRKMEVKDKGIKGEIEKVRKRAEKLEKELVRLSGGSWR